MSYGSQDRILPKYGKGRGRFRHVRQYFLKPFFKGKNFAVKWERGKFDFDHYFAFLTNFLKR